MRKHLHILEDVVQPYADTDGGDKARREVARYTGDEGLGDSWTDHGPLKWCARSYNCYPHLAQLALKYLAIPEQAFSIAGNIVNIKRSCLLATRQCEYAGVLGF